MSQLHHPLERLPRKDIIDVARNFHADTSALCPSEGTRLVLEKLPRIDIIELCRELSSWKYGVSVRARWRGGLCKSLKVAR